MCTGVALWQVQERAGSLHRLAVRVEPEIGQHHAASDMMRRYRDGLASAYESEHTQAFESIGQWMCWDHG